MAAAAVELDPVFVKALRLLHSKAKDSTAQLKALLDESIRQKKGQHVSPPNLIRKDRIAPPPQRSTPENEKRNLDKLKRELSELMPDPTKRVRLDSPARSFSSKSHTPSPTPPGSRGEKSSGPNSSGDDSDMEVNLDALNDCMCRVCKSFNQENGNKLMECHTCQNLYHQECHSPPVSNDEALDPRFIWNCSNCSKSLKKPSSSSVKSSSSSSKSLSSSSKGSSSLSSIKSRPSPSKSGDSSGQVFKRVDAKGSGMASGNGKGSGMASLAASLKTSNSSSKSSSGSSSKSSSKSSSSSSSSSSTLLAADKRLQMMKKKAAAARKK